MTNEQIEKSIKTKELQLGMWDKLTHYGLVLFLFFIPIMFIVMSVNPLLHGNFTGFDVIIWFILIPTGVGLLFYKVQKGRLKFTLIEANLPRTILNSTIENVAKELNWTFKKVDEKIVIAQTNPGLLSGSWGEQITILFNKNQILVNSICDPDKKSSVVSAGRNKKNVSALIDGIKNANH
jgi:hypothetical protein